ncbi:DNA cytosine methyltransferase [Clostridium estertheticum]|uniref:DNA cytosine methyltransferase n=1 Tax=Clostridium estertheticum TaxID=238834 RepID=UPI001C0CD24D|nr:DNA cytosine methyltransferase [Clostridium estertheticum]MBU3075607.1 DNA cytosine methyltransferase [Clostridium estertheticum]MBU3164811.1 DNA cytosine methyltransferase [Clostridium estertheticum]
MEKLRGLSLFANVGIAEAYFSEIGIDMRVANELIEKRARFYKEIYHETDMVCGDITNELVRDEVVNKAIKEHVNFVIATPPCQGMSVAGSRYNFDERNQLIYYAIDVIKRVNPEYVLLENVPRQLKTKIIVDGNEIGIPEYINNELGDFYNFNSETLIKAKDYGVPQLRQRNIFLLVRKDKSVAWDFPEKKEEITLEEAIGDLPPLDPTLREGIEFTHSKFPDYEKKKEAGLKVSKWHRPMVHSWKQVEWMIHTATGTSAIFNDVYYPQKEGGIHIKAHHNHYRRLSWDKPSRTITQNNGVMSSLCCVHPGRPYECENEILYSDPRVLTIYELLIVMSLPLNWNIPEWAEESFIRRVIGEGIPSKLVKVLMLELLKQI